MTTKLQNLLGCTLYLVLMLESYTSTTNQIDSGSQAASVLDSGTLTHISTISKEMSKLTEGATRSHMVS